MDENIEVTKEEETTTPTNPEGDSITPAPDVSSPEEETEGEEAETEPETV